LTVPLRGQQLLVAFAGGADSLALLVLLCALRETLGLGLAAAHLDHALREESAEDARAAAAFCETLGIPFFCRREDVRKLAEEQGRGLEDAGRHARYAFLEQCRQDCGASWIVTAHHVGDLEEDILLRLVRGAAWPALGGMRAVLPERCVLRPLLMMEKRDLESLLERVGAVWREDASNESREWRRNRMRHDVLPLLHAENPSFSETARRLWRNAREDEVFWKERLEGVIEPCEDGLFLSRKALKALGRAGMLRAVAAAVKQMDCGQTRADILEAMLEAWEQSRFPRVFVFPGFLKAEMTGRGIRFYRSESR